MTTAAKPLVSSHLLSRGFGKGADFDIYTRAAAADASSERPIIRMIGSSTVKDLQGDTMEITALEDMTRCDPNLTIFIDHTYDLPDSVYGSLAEQPAIQMQNGIADLHLSVETDFSRPTSKARDIYTQISKGKIRLGCSIGCQVLDYTFDGDEDDWFAPIIIHRVYTVEFSIVGIPANQRSWVEQAVKGLFERSLAEGRGDDARRLAPVMKSLWDGPYDAILREIESEGLRRDLARTRARGTGPQRILFDFAQNGFVLAGPKNARKSLAVEEVHALLEKAAPGTERTEDAEADDLESTKAASGKTSWPLMDIKTEWTGSKAEKQIFDYAKNEDGAIQASKAKQCFLWYDPDKSDIQDGYKFPFVYVSGSPKIVPLGVRACANILNGGMGGTAVSSEDQSAMRARCKTMYGRINSEFHPDPEWEVPWEKKDDEKSIAPDSLILDGVTYTQHEDGSFLALAREIADSESDAALNRQDLGEVTIKADGSHEPFTGTHSHAHKAYGSQGGDDMHTHEHSHDNDAHHGHDHAEKQAEPETTKAAGCGCCDDCTGEEGCTCCDACTVHGAKAEEKSLTTDEQGAKPGIKPVTLALPTPEQTALLSVYNTIGKQLGFPEHTLTTKCDLVPTQGDAAIVRATLSALDDCSDALIEMAQRNDGYVDALMAMMGVPDTNDGDGDGARSLSGLYSISPEEAKAALDQSLKHYKGDRILLKEGREFSSKNTSQLQLIHDTVAAMYPDACKGVSGDGPSHQDGSTTVEEAQEEARQMGQGDSYSNLSSLMAETCKTVLLKAFEGLEAKPLVEASVKTAVDAAIADAHTNLEALRREQMTLMQQVAKLANMPLPRPNTLQRSVTPVSPYALDNTATYQDMLSVAGIEAPKQTLAEALAQTSIVEVPITRNGETIRTKYRRWPAGVGGAVGEGVRPALTPAQKTLMHYLDWGAYNAASGTVDVPLVDDPAERI